MAEFWFENVPASVRRARRSTTGRRRRRANNNAGGGLLMLANKRRRRTHRRNPGLESLALLNRRRKRRTSRRKYYKGASVHVKHVLNRRRRRSNPRRHRGGGGGVPAGMAGFVSARFLTTVGYGALGALTPTLVTDKILPMVGLQFSGLTRRIVQLAVPALVLAAGGKRLLGPGAYPFAVTGMAVAAVGLANDLTGGIAMLGAYARPAPVMGRYGPTAPALRG